MIPDIMVETNLRYNEYSFILENRERSMQKYADEILIKEFPDLLYKQNQLDKENLDLWFEDFKIRLAKAQCIYQINKE